MKPRKDFVPKNFVSISALQWDWEIEVWNKIKQSSMKYKGVLHSALIIQWA